jgi:four helix bundle protein
LETGYQGKRKGGNIMEDFAFEKLEIYKRSINFVLAIRKLCASLKAEYDILDQLKRASLSISLNIAEGSGRFHKNDKKHFYFIARGSLFECIPIITILRREEILDEDKYNGIYKEANLIARMLTKLIQSMDKK